MNKAGLEEIQAESWKFYKENLPEDSPVLDLFISKIYSAGLENKYSVVSFKRKKVIKQRVN